MDKRKIIFYLLTVGLFVSCTPVIPLSKANLKSTDNGMISYIMVQSDTLRTEFYGDYQFFKKNHFLWKDLEHTLKQKIRRNFEIKTIGNTTVLPYYSFCVLRKKGEKFIDFSQEIEGDISDRFQKNNYPYRETYWEHSNGRIFLHIEVLDTPYEYLFWANTATSFSPTPDQTNSRETKMFNRDKFIKEVQSVVYGTSYFPTRANTAL
jgi:hypothetical protein